MHSVAVAAAPSRGVAPAPAAAEGKGPETRTNLDKREARRRYALHFDSTVRAFRAALPGSAAALRQRPPGRGAVSGGGGGVSVFVRKRPLFDREKAKGEFDVISVVDLASAVPDAVVSTPPSSPREGGGAHYHPPEPPDPAVIVHNCAMHADMKRMFARHSAYRATAVFGERADNAAVYAGTASPLVRAAAAAYRVSTLFMYGQTGSGKTYTMSAIERAGFTELFDAMEEGATATASYFELAGKRVVDLLQPANAVAQQSIKLMEDSHGSVVVRGSVAAPVASAAELLSVLNKGKSRRATEATEINAGSSRSHAVCQIAIRPPPGGGAAGAEPGAHGLLTLVDCAGSERKEDSMYHSAERRKEGAEINASLHALKECIRHRMMKSAGGGGGGGEGAAAAHVPFRSSNLTKVLMESFTRADALLAMIATLSPTPTDTEHSVATLRTVRMLSGDTSEVVEVEEEVQLQLPKVKLYVPPAKWDADSVRKWVGTTKRGRFKAYVAALPSSLDGKVLLRYSRNQCTTLCGSNEMEGIALFNALRDELAKAGEAKSRAAADRIGAVKNARLGKQR